MNMQEVNALIKQRDEWKRTWVQAKLVTERLGAQILGLFKESFPIGSTVTKDGEKYQVGSYDRDMLFCYKIGEGPIDKDTMFGLKPDEVEIVP